jgi:hypothetical protein
MNLPFLRGNRPGSQPYRGLVEPVEFRANLKGAGIAVAFAGLYSMDMTGSVGNYWLLWAGSVGVGVILLAIGLWALYAGRPRGKVCPRCQFNLSGSDELACPNCGFASRRKRVFRAKARHPWLAVTCFVVLNAGVVLLVWRQFEPSWIAMVPDRVLIMLLPWSSDDRGPVQLELFARLSGDKFSESEVRMLIDRSVRGDRHGEPFDPSWRERYGEVLHRLRYTQYAKRDMLDGMYAAPLSLQLLSRDHWPDDTAICVQLRIEDWWPLGTEVRIRATSSVAEVEPITFIRTGSYAPANRFAMFFPSFAEGDHTIAFDLSLERRRVDRDEAWQDAGSRQMSVSFTVKGSMDDVLPPVQRAELDETMEALFSIGIARWESGASPVRVYFEPEKTFRPEFQDVAIGASVRVMYDGTLVRRMNLWWLGGPQHKAPEEWNLGWEVPWEDLEMLTHAPGDDGKWTVQVVALQDVALRVVGATRYWDGAISVSTEVFERAGEAPPVPWRVVDD